MKPRYFLQIPAGADKLVASVIEASAPRCAITYRDPSALLVEGPLDVGSVRYAATLHRVLTSVEARGLERAALQLLGELHRRDVRRAPTPFRVMFSHDGQLVGVAPKVRRRVESALASATGGQLTPRGGGREFWVLARHGMSVVILTEKLRSARKTAPGSLSQSLAELLVLASKPRASDVFWDPFCGSGSIGLARAAYPASSILCSDIDEASIPRLPAGGQGSRGIGSRHSDGRLLCISTPVPRDGRLRGHRPPLGGAWLCRDERGCLCLPAG